MKIVAIVQARLGSTRLPEKVLKKVNGRPLIEILLHRLSKSEKIGQIVLATSIKSENDKLVSIVKNLGYEVFRGDEEDVLDRYYNAAIQYEADIVIRITGDCPLVDPALIDFLIEEYQSENVDYLSNINPPTYPDGLDIEVFSFSALETTSREAFTKHDREHATPYIRESGKFRTMNITNDNDYSEECWALDSPEDYEVIQSIFKHFAPRVDFAWEEVLELRYLKPELFSSNLDAIRNEGSIIGTGQKLWKRAKQVIPGGNMLLSKRAEMFLPEKWPTYYSKSKGCKVWDLDGIEYTDMSIMGIGTNILGFGHPEVDEVVLNTVKSGNMSTFNCPEEVLLAEKLVDMHPWADMARFARSGGEANAIAIRIARAASGKDKIAICGYHGWHDWYLATNLNKSNGLDEHLLPGLDPAGVPQGLKGTTLPFRYNHFEDLLDLVTNHDIGVIKMEVQRNEPPLDGFLEKVRQLATEKGIVLIFDECTSGFREAFGGLHKKHGVDPDMAIFGKAMGNGYAISAVIGRREIMEASQSTFISSTFWTERIGPSAALKTLEVMEREQSWKQITKTGLKIREYWQKLADRHKIKISHWGLPSLSGFTIQSEHAMIYKTLITQEMLAKGYLAANSIYVCTDHTQKVLDGYFAALDDTFKLIRECEEGRNPLLLLQSPVCHSGFKRLN